MEVSGPASLTGRFTSWEESLGAHWVGGWVRPQRHLGRRGNRTPIYRPSNQRLLLNQKFGLILSDF
jgi:hypothetical protein